MPTPKHQLGVPYYTVARDGELSRQLITRLPFALSENSFWSLTKAVAVAKTRTAAALAATDSKKHEAVYEKRLAALADDAQAYVQALPYAETEEGMFSLGRTLIDFTPPPLLPEHIPDAQRLFAPGDKVWMPVTPTTHNMMSPHFRPEAYFVLQTYVKEVSLKSYFWTGGWRVFYNLDSNYQLRDTALLHASKDAAVTQLCQLLEKQTPARAIPEQVRTYTRRQEKAHDRKTTEEISARHDRVNRFAA